MPYWAVSGKFVHSSSKWNARQTEAAVHLLCFPFLYTYAVIYRRPLGWDSVLEKEAKKIAVSAVWVSSALGHTSEESVIKYTHKHQYMLELLCFAVSWNSVPHLKIFSSCQIIFFFIFWLRQHHCGFFVFVGWGGRYRMQPTSLPKNKLNLLLVPHSKCLNQRCAAPWLFNAAVLTDML